MNPTTPAHTAQPSVFTVDVEPAVRRYHDGVGQPVELTTDTGMKIWTPLLGPSSVLCARLLLDQPGRTWHIADVAGQLGVGVEYAQRIIRRLTVFGWITAEASDDVAVYRVLPGSDLTAPQLHQLHPELAALYARHGGLVSEGVRS